MRHPGIERLAAIATGMDHHHAATWLTRLNEGALVYKAHPTKTRAQVAAVIEVAEPFAELRPSDTPGGMLRDAIDEVRRVLG